MISLAFKRIVQANKLQLVQRPKFLCRHESVNKFSSLAPRTNLIDTMSIQSTKFPQISFLTRRTIYDSSSLEIDSLETHRLKTSQLLKEDKEACISRIKKYIETADKDCLLLEDMINLIGLAENEEHLDLIENFISLMKDEVDLVGWAASLMRLYYKMNQPDRAFNNIMDSAKFGNVFHSYTSYRIALTMLYDADRHEDVIELYNHAVASLKSKPPRNESERTVQRPGQYPGLALIALASLAKSNPPGALAVAESIYTSLDSDYIHNYNDTRMKAFLAYLAIQNNKWGSALNMIASTPGKNYFTLRELKTLALIKLNRFEDVLYHIKYCIQICEGRGAILAPHYELLEEKLGEIENGKLQEEIRELLVEIKRDESAITHLKLEDRLFSKVVAKAKTTTFADQGSRSDSYNSRRYTNNDNYNSGDFNDFNNNRQFNRRRPNNQRDNRYQPKSYLDEDKMDY